VERINVFSSIFQQPGRRHAWVAKTDVLVAMTVTSISLPGLHAPTASLEVPLEMLAACHGRVEKQCETLLHLLEHLDRFGVDTQAQEAIAAVIRYFDTAAVHHHADEEIDLFPALLEAMAGSDAVCIRALTEGLTQDHVRLSAQWAALKTSLQALQNARADTKMEPELGSLTQAFVSAYRQHIEREETELLPMANRLLDDAQLDRIGISMRWRRGL